MDIIRELWYGNVAPFEQCTRGDKQLKELLKLVARNKEELDATLTDKQKETLEKFEENMNEMHGIFICGSVTRISVRPETFIATLTVTVRCRPAQRYTMR